MDKPVKPVCECGHQYYYHGGSARCYANECPCLVYRPNEIKEKPVPHEPNLEVWEKALASQPDPVIQKTETESRVEAEVKAEVQKLDAKCVCGHPKEKHSKVGCRWLFCENAGKPGFMCSCMGYVEAKSGVDMPLCTCGHKWESHDVNEEYECAECWNDSEIPIQKLCEGYKPDTGEVISDKFEDVNKEALKLLNNGTVPKYSTYQGKSWEGYSTGGQTAGAYFQKCTHPPTKVINSKKHGWEVWVGQKIECGPYLEEFDVILNCANAGPVVPRHVMPFAWAKKYRTIKAKEIQINWPDMSYPQLQVEFWGDLIKYLTKTKGKLLIFCIGGHGRTGTALAALMIAWGYDTRAAVKWIRKNYCTSAIETTSQEDYLRRVGDYYGKKKQAQKKAKGAKNGK